MLFFLFLSSWIVSGFCRDLTELKQPLFNAETNLDQDLDGIVGGDEVSIKDYPHQVALFLQDEFHCAGFIVSENFILTVAQCLVIKNTEIVARAGSAFQNGTIIPIAEVIIHPEYNTSQFDYDVGVLKTKDPIEFNDVIKAIPLPKKGREMEKGTDVVISGWGRTEEDGDNSDQLVAVKTLVIDQAQCQESYQEYFTKNMFCAGDYDMGGTGPCYGDAGGPVQQDGMAVGIVSWGRGCARPKFPAVYTNIAVPAIRDFITEHTGL